MSREYGKIMAINAHNANKAVQVLMGICGGIVADNEINEKELRFLNQWLKEHAEVTQSWPGSVIATWVGELVADRVIAPEKLTHLLHSLQELTGNIYEETGVAAQDVPVLPIDPDHEIDFAGKLICFTGKFLFGSRDSCESAAVQQGCIAEPRITKRLDYLVIGSFCSPDWVNTTYGLKIAKAVEYRTQHGRPRIISEEQWIAARSISL